MQIQPDHPVPQFPRVYSRLGGKAERMSPTWAAAGI